MKATYLSILILKANKQKTNAMAAIAKLGVKNTPFSLNLLRFYNKVA